MIGTKLDKLIGVVFPGVALRRMAARATMSQMDAFTSAAGGYDGGKVNRLTKNWARGALNENAIPTGQVSQLRVQSWNLFRNNPHARKIVRSLESKVIGRGLCPQSLAVHADGTPNVEFRQRVARLWRAIADEMDYRGRPGGGGLSLVDLQRQALRSTILDGEVLYRLRPLNPLEQASRRATLPVVLQLIHAERLDASATVASKSGGMVYRGIELDSSWARVAYHLFAAHPADPLNYTQGETTRVPAAEIGHLFAADDVDQLRGVPWFAPALMQMRDTGDYQFNELKASAIAACVALGVRRPTGASQLGLGLPTDWDSTDTDGNRLTAMQPGMIVDLGTSGDLQGFNPSRPSTNAEAWIQHMIRSTATAIPGVKASTLTGDYRNSSFSSEKSADNDAWPELESAQDWIAGHFCQPIFEAVIRVAMLEGYFAGVVNEAEFNAREKEFLAAAWQGPVARSINPTDDAKASALEIENGTSSPQIECAKRGRNWQEVVSQIAEFRQYATAAGLPQPLVDQWSGVAEAVVTGTLAAEAATDVGTEETADDESEIEAAA